ncbi:MAG: PEP-CTERM sorting domain-containing protein [Oleiphilaceae bacterium]|uniref:PEP-CTERM sorting domain-containing protein n=1 Tax=Oleiphilus sp. HI0125 TaxID=1822266 RepID=UPI0007C31B20|nr:PEP-CTERM sorting domain-containing protein [Oleiphilus sp. HI0125]KZZ58823.1 hypothetical protein A3762_06530 [Oleiphilus sp. HI0125]KZZ58888.1 hypothetical protein A3762_17635 [Oleiphilus sp. HI0125]MCH2159826.1 PEP-CTERM sorting domain-containing protein [Oleiphilaceae bacterium]
MNYKKLLGLAAATILSTSANAAMFVFDDTSDTETKFVSSIDFGDFEVTAGYTNGLNLGNAGSFSKTTNTFAGEVYWDTNPANGGLGLTSPLNSSDGLDSNFQNNAGSDEVLFFEFDTSTILDTVWFNGSHKDLVTADRNNNIYDGGDALFNIFASADGIDYTSVFSPASNGHYQQAPIDRDYLTTGVDMGYMYYAVASTGWGSHSSYVEKISYNAVSEPATLALLGLGVLGLGAARRRSAK